LYCYYKNVTALGRKLKGGRIPGNFNPRLGLGMNEFTPKDKLLASKTMIHWHVLLFPTLFPVSVFKSISPFSQFLNQSIGGKYVCTRCRIIGTPFFVRP
jgi:hypothetical protein